MAGGAEMIANTPALRPELERVYPELKAMARPVGPDGVKGALLPLVLVFGDKRVESESPMFWEMYAAALSKLPAKALHEAVRKWVQVGKWFPKPAELKELAEERAVRIRAAEYRARVAMQAPEPKPAERMPREAVAKLMKEISQHLARAEAGRAA